MSGQKSICEFMNPEEVEWSIQNAWIGSFCILIIYA